MFVYKHARNELKLNVNKTKTKELHRLSEERKLSPEKYYDSKKKKIKLLEGSWGGKYEGTRRNCFIFKVAQVFADRVNKNTSKILDHFQHLMIITT